MGNMCLVVWQKKDSADDALRIMQKGMCVCVYVYACLPLVDSWSESEHGLAQSLVFLCLITVIGLQGLRRFL